MPSIEELSSEYLEDVKTMYEQDMVNKDLVASGKTKSMLRIETNAGGGMLYGSKAMIFLKYGRGPGKFPPPPAMVQAIENRGGPRGGMSIEQAAYLLGRKIALFGTDIFMGKRKGIDIDKELQTRTNKLNEDIGKSFFAQVVDKLRKRK